MTVGLIVNMLREKLFMLLTLFMLSREEELNCMGTFLEGVIGGFMLSRKEELNCMGFNNIVFRLKINIETLMGPFFIGWVRVMAIIYCAIRRGPHNMAIFGS